MADEPKQESFEEFKNSFSYGSRTDLNFKFLKGLPTEEAADFFQELLWKLGDSFDDGQFGRVIEHVFRWQARAYTAGEGPWSYDEGPFTPLPKPLAETRLALVTSTGHFVEGDDPEPFGVKQMTQAEAIRRISDFTRSEPQLSAIPIDTPREKLRVRHGGYDIRGVQLDPNVAFPLELLLECEREGVIGKLAPDAYSFVGATSQIRLLKQAGPRWVQTIRQQQVEAVLLVPV